MKEDKQLHPAEQAAASGERHSLSDGRPSYEERPWGSYTVLDYLTFADGHHVLTKELRLNAGGHISYQRHFHRSETWTVADGEGILVLGDKRSRVRRGDNIVIPRQKMHGIKAISPLTIIEVQAGPLLEETDIERFDYDWDAEQ